MHLSSGAINSGQIGNNAVVSGSIASGQVGQYHIASGSITAEHIASGAVIAADISDNAVISGKIASGIVAWFNLASGSVRSGHIGNAAVVSGSIASGQIGTVHMASGSYFTVNNYADNRILTSVDVSTAYAETNLTYDGTTLDLNSTASGSTVFQIDGTQQQLLKLSDSTVGNLLEVGSVSGTPILTVNSLGYTKLYSATFSGQIANVNLFSIPDTSGNAIFVDYYIKRTDALGWRAGNIMAVWDDSADLVEYTETATNDLGTTTEYLTLSANITSNNLILAANITSGTYNINIGTRLL